MTTPPLPPMTPQQEQAGIFQKQNQNQDQNVNNTYAPSSTRNTTTNSNSEAENVVSQSGSLLKYPK